MEYIKKNLTSRSFNPKLSLMPSILFESIKLENLISLTINMKTITNDYLKNPTNNIEMNQINSILIVLTKLKEIPREQTKEIIQCCIDILQNQKIKSRFKYQLDFHCLDFLNKNTKDITSDQLLKIFSSFKILKNRIELLYLITEFISNFHTIIIDSKKENEIYEELVNLLNFFYKQKKFWLIYHYSIENLFKFLKFTVYKDIKKEMDKIFTQNIAEYIQKIPSEENKLKQYSSEQLKLSLQKRTRDFPFIQNEIKKMKMENQIQKIEEIEIDENISNCENELKKILEFVNNNENVNEKLNELRNLMKVMKEIEKKINE